MPSKIKCIPLRGVHRAAKPGGPYCGAAPCTRAAARLLAWRPLQPTWAKPGLLCLLCCSTTTGAIPLAVAMAWTRSPRRAAA